MLTGLIFAVTAIIFCAIGFAFGRDAGTYEAKVEDQEQLGQYGPDEFMEATLRLVDILDTLIKVQTNHNQMTLQLLNVLQRMTGEDKPAVTQVTNVSNKLPN